MAQKPHRIEQHIPVLLQFIQIFIISTVAKTTYLSNIYLPIHKKIVMNLVKLQRLPIVRSTLQKSNKYHGGIQLELFAPAQSSPEISIAVACVPEIAQSILLALSPITSWHTRFEFSHRMSNPTYFTNWISL